MKVRITCSLQDAMSDIVVGITATDEVEPALASPSRRPAGATCGCAWCSPSATSPMHVATSGPHLTSRAAAAVVRAPARVSGGHRVPTRVTLMEEEPVSALLRASAAAAFLVVGCHSAGTLRRGLLGSVSTACPHDSLTPVTTVPVRTWSQPDRWLTSRVLVGLDGSLASLSALIWAVRHPREWEGSLHPVVVTASREPMPAALGQAGDDLEAIVHSQVTRAGGRDLQVRPHYLNGVARNELLKILDPGDLLVVGSRGHGPVTSVLLGSTSPAVAEAAPCP